MSNSSNQKYTQDLIQFLKTAPTSFHACQSMAEALKSAHFSELDEKKKWQIKLGGRYFIRRGGSLIALQLPLKKLQEAKIIAGHTDSPALKVKPLGEFEKEDFILLNFEVYGSPILASWLGRDLALAGRIFFQQENDNELASELVFYDKYPLIIPHLAIHLDRSVNESGPTINKQEHLSAIVCHKSSLPMGKSFLSTLFKGKNVVHTELFAVPLEEPRFCGVENELLASYRLDNLVSCQAALSALLSTEQSDSALQACLLWNHEEVGSETYEGASSTFFNDILCRVNDLLGNSREEFFTVKANSMTVSVDVAHGVHPNYQEKSEPRHKAFLGAGVAIKMNAQERYASSGELTGSFLATLKNEGIMPQTYLCRGDIPCGSTVGPLHAAKTGIQSIDIGIPLLGMHAAREVIHMADYLDLIKVLQIALNH